MVYKMKLNKTNLTICLFAILTLFLHFAVLQYRGFFEVENITFTFWTTLDGCYIMPYKYQGITKPKDNYMKVPNSSGGYIFIGEESTLYILAFNDYYVQEGDIVINFSSYKYEYVPYLKGTDNTRFFYDKLDYYKNQDYPYINYYLPSMGISIGNAETVRLDQPDELL